MKLITGHPTLCCHASQHRPAPEAGAEGGTSPLPPHPSLGQVIAPSFTIGSAFTPLIRVLLFILTMVFKVTFKYLLKVEVFMTFFDNLFW